MGTSTTAAEVAKKIDAAAKGLADGTEQGVRRASIEAKNVLRAKAIKPMTGGDERLSGRKNAKISLGFNVKGKGERTRSDFKVRGPIMLVEADVPAHSITPKRKYAKGGRRGGRRAALKFGGEYATRANHPGTRGKGLFKRVRDRDVVKLSKKVIFENTTNKVLEPFI